MNTTGTPVISRRQQAAGPLHHLWNNHGHWWIHYTLHLPDFTAKRVRASLGTRDLETAKTKRDGILSNLATSQPSIAA